MQGQSPRQLIFILGLMAFWCNGDNYVAAPLIVEIAKEFHLDIGTAALPVSAYMLPFGLFTLLFGPLADRYGKAKVINLAAFGSAIFCGLGALAGNIVSLSLIRAVSGAFAAAILPVTMSLIGDSFGHDPKAMQNALGQVLGMAFMGGAAGTAIGGGLAFLGSWRLVYLVYGAAGLLLAFIMWKTLEKKPGTVSSLNISKAYQDAFANADLLKTVSIIFLMGFSVFGSFTYTGKFVQMRTGFNILWIGLILTCFGLAAVLGGRRAGACRQKMGNRVLLLAGGIALISWAAMGVWHSATLISLSLAGFGLGFIVIQSTLISTAQQLLPKRRGTAMSLASFNMFVGGGLGTLINGHILAGWGFGPVFVIAGGLIFLAGVIANLLLRRLSPISIATTN